MRKIDMNIALNLTVLLLAVFMAISLAQDQEKQKEMMARYEAFQKELSTIKSLPDPTDRVDQAIKLINNNPDSPYVYSLLMLIKNNITAADGNSDRAIDFMGKVVQQVENEFRKMNYRFIALELYGESTHPDTFKAKAQAYLGDLDEEMRQFYYQPLAVAAAQCVDFDFALELIEKAITFQEKNIETRTGRQKQLSRRSLNGCLTDKAVILSKMGKHQEAVALFDKLSNSIETDVLGWPSGTPSFKGEIAYHWGNVLAAAGDKGNALEKYAYAAVVKEDKKALSAAESLFANIDESGAGFDNYLKMKSIEFAKTAPDFTLMDLDGKEVTLSSYKGKVVLLYFWAHT